MSALFFWPASNDFLGPLCAHICPSTLKNHAAPVMRKTIMADPAWSILWLWWLHQRVYAWRAGEEVASAGKAGFPHYLDVRATRVEQHRGWGVTLIMLSHTYRFHSKNSSHHCTLLQCKRQQPATVVFSLVPQDSSDFFLLSKQITLDNVQGCVQHC